MKTPHWKVKKLAEGRWLAHHHGCPPRDHFCIRWLTGLPHCRVLPTLAEAYQEAAERYRSDVANDWAIITAPQSNPRTLAPALQPHDNHLHIWTRLWDAGAFYIGCTICRRPRY